MRPLTVPALALLLGACGGGGTTPDAPSAPPPSTEPGPAPWNAPALAPTRVPEVLLQQWVRAGNRATCAPLAPTAGVRNAAAPRAATFAGGWAVAWDLPGERSAFGVAGTGVEARAPSYDAWPRRMVWDDGSTAGYGPEGGSGPKQLAYLRVAGEGCLYNVWSTLGVEHLETLLGGLRFVNPP